MEIYIYQNGQQVGPYDEAQIRGMAASGTITESDLGWHAGITEWQPLNTIISFPTASASKPAPAIPPPVKAKEQVIQTNVKQGALIGGLVCFLLGVGLMFLSMWSFFFYGPLFLVAFILSIVAMSQRRIFGGIMLLLATLIVPTILGLILFSTRTVKLAEKMNKRIEAERTAAVANASSDKPTASEPAATPIASQAVEDKKPDVAETTATPLPPTAPAKSKYAALDEKNGFRTFQLGAPLSSFSSMKLEKSDMNSPDEKGFFVQEYDKKIGNAELSGILLIFSQDILKEIYVKTEGEQNKLGLKEALIAAYGQPERGRSFMSEQLVWEGNKTKLILDSGMNVNAIFSNKDVDAKIQELIQQKAKAGAAAGAKSL